MFHLVVHSPLCNQMRIRLTSSPRRRSPSSQPAAFKDADKLPERSSEVARRVLNHEESTKFTGWNARKGTICKKGSRFLSAFSQICGKRVRNFDKIFRKFSKNWVCNITLIKISTVLRISNSENPIRT